MSSILAQNRVTIIDYTETASATLSRESYVVKCDSDNVPLNSPLNATTRMRVLLGNSEVTSLMTYSASGEGATFSISNEDDETRGVLRVTEITQDEVVITITASKAEIPSLVKEFTITKVADGSQGEMGASVSDVSIKFSSAIMNLDESNQSSDIIINAQRVDDFRTLVTANGRDIEYLNVSRIYPFHLARDTVRITQIDIDSGYEGLYTERGDKFLDILGKNKDEFDKVAQVGILGEDQPMSSVLDLIPFTKVLGITGAEVTAVTSDMATVYGGGVAELEFRSNDNLLMNTRNDWIEVSTKDSHLVATEQVSGSELGREFQLSSYIDNSRNAYPTAVEVSTSGRQVLGSIIEGGESGLSTIKYEVTQDIVNAGFVEFRLKNVDLASNPDGLVMKYKGLKLERADLDNEISLPSAWTPFHTNTNLFGETSHSWVDIDIWSYAHNLFTRPLTSFDMDKEYVFSAHLSNKANSSPIAVEIVSGTTRVLGNKIEGGSEGISVVRYKVTRDMIYSTTVLHRIKNVDYTSGQDGFHIKCRNSKLEHADLNNGVQVPSVHTEDGLEVSSSRIITVDCLGRNLFNGDYNQGSIDGISITTYGPTPSTSWLAKAKIPKGSKFSVVKDKPGSKFRVGTCNSEPELDLDIFNSVIKDTSSFITSKSDENSEYALAYVHDSVDSGGPPKTSIYLGDEVHSYSDYVHNEIRLTCNVPHRVELLDGPNTFSTEVPISVIGTKENRWFDYVDFEEPTLGGALNIKRLTASITSGELHSSDGLTLVRNGDSYTINILSSNGNTFRLDSVETTLTCQVLKNNKDVTDSIPKSKFRWRRVTGNDSLDNIWNASEKARYTRYLEVTTEDCLGRSVFNCEVDLEGV